MFDTNTKEMLEFRIYLMEVNGIGNSQALYDALKAKLAKLS